MVHYLSFEWLGWMLVTVFLYWLTPAIYRRFVIPALTLLFLLVYSPLSAFVLIFVTLVSFFSSTRKPATHWRPLLGGFIIVTILVYFKLQTSLSGFASVMPTTLSATLIPLGLSYYSFRAIHFLIERYRGHVVCESLLSYIAYMFFLPTISVGPIHRIREFLADLDTGEWNASYISSGLQRIIYGYAKISILSGYVLPHVFSYIRSHLVLLDNAVAVYVEMVEQGLNLYFLFSGYSDIAIGFALLLGYRVMENFDYPYLKSNLGDFWRSWHISLTSWTRDYIYMPSLAVTRSPRIAVVSTFIVIGLWHEISLQFALWGLWHAVGIMIWQEYNRLKRRLFGTSRQKSTSRLPGLVKNGLGALLTAHYFFASMIIIKSSDLHEAAEKFGKLFFSW